MLFRYEALDRQGNKQQGVIEAMNQDVAISAIQRRNLVITSIKNIEERSSIFKLNISFLNRVSNKDIVILSRQLATLFNAQVSALRVFTLLAAEASNQQLRKHLSEVADDLQSGSSISRALSKHPKVFSNFYVSMVRAGEESGKLDQTFNYLADYLDRTYDVTSRAKNALVYPSFIVVVFVGVMVFMLTAVIPKITVIIESSGQDIPIYTKIVIWVSNLFSHYGFYLLIGVIVVGYTLFRYSRKETGKASFSRLKLTVPYLSTLYKKLYLSRIADNMHTMLSSAIPIVKALEITGSVVGDVTYEAIMDDVVNEVRKGSSVSDAMAKHKEMPGILVQMVKVGEETGEMGNILETLAKFYSREVTNAVETIIGLIEPAMIILLALGVGVLLASVLLPIYNLAGSIS